MSRRVKALRRIVSGYEKPAREARRAWEEQRALAQDSLDILRRPRPLIVMGADVPVVQGDQLTGLAQSVFGIDRKPGEGDDELRERLRQIYAPGTRQIYVQAWKAAL